jgi:hypothetical protein
MEIFISKIILDEHFQNLDENHVYMIKNSKFCLNLTFILVSTSRQNNVLAKAKDIMSGLSYKRLNVRRVFPSAATYSQHSIDPPKMPGFPSLHKFDLSFVRE